VSGFFSRQLPSIQLSEIKHGVLHRFQHFDPEAVEVGGVTPRPERRLDAVAEDHAAGDVRDQERA
jgi:hypothetical protein